MNMKLTYIRLVELALAYCVVLVCVALAIVGS